MKEYTLETDVDGVFNFLPFQAVVLISSIT